MPVTRARIDKHGIVRKVRVTHLKRWTNANRGRIVRSKYAGRKATSLPSSAYAKAKEAMRKVVEAVEATPSVSEIMDEADDLLKGIKGYSNFGFKRTVDAQLRTSMVQDEGGGWYQINAYTGSTKNSAPVKIRYNPKQRKIEAYIRGYAIK